MYVEADWDCHDLLHNASQRLEIIPAAQKIFNADGMTTTITMIGLGADNCTCLLCRQ